MTIPKCVICRKQAVLEARIAAWDRWEPFCSSCQLPNITEVRSLENVILLATLERKHKLSAAKRAYYKLNGEKIRQRSREYNRTHREAIAAHGKRYYRKNRERILTRQKLQYRIKCELRKAA